MLNFQMVEDILQEKIVAQKDLGAGGSLASAGTLTLASGKQLFFKQKSQPSSMFVEEKKGLERLSISESLVIPTPYYADEFGLVMEYLDTSPRGRDQEKQLAVGLAKIHQQVKSDYFGLPSDNFIGATPQKNRQEKSWGRFFIQHRLQFQFKLAKSRNLIDQTFASDFQRLIEEVAPTLLAETDEAPTLLHGDLWSRNVLATERGPALIDPAVYYGQREADLGMTMLFGGFSSAFYRAYQEEYPLKPGWERRANFYNIYHLLNHMNLMGAGHTGQTWRLVKSFL